MEIPLQKSSYLAIPVEIGKTKCIYIYINGFSCLFGGYLGRSGFLAFEF